MSGKASAVYPSTGATSARAAANIQRRIALKIALWIVQILLAVAFLAAAALKLFGFQAMAAHTPGIGELHALFVFIAGGFHVARGEIGEVPGALVLVCLALFVVWGRGIKTIGMI